MLVRNCAIYKQSISALPSSFPVPHVLPAAFIIGLVLCHHCSPFSQHSSHLSPPTPQVRGAPSSHKVFAYVVCSARNGFPLSLPTPYPHLEGLLILHTSSYTSLPLGSSRGHLQAVTSPLCVLAVPSSSPSDLSAQPVITFLITLSMSVRVCLTVLEYHPQEGRA